MPESVESEESRDEPEAKRFRSVKEYREMKRRQKLTNMGADRSVSPEPAPKAPNNAVDNKDEFVKLLKDTVAHLCYGRLVNFDDFEDEESDVPEWRRVSRIISQTLLEKESRMPPEFRYKIAPTQAKEAAIKRIQAYTIAYLDRKYPK